MFAALLDTDDGALITIPQANVQDVGSSTASAGIQFQASGAVTGLRVAQGDQNLGTWINPASMASLYTIRADVLLGSLTSGTTGQDLSLGSTQSWTVARNTEGTSTVVLQLTIKFQGTTVVDVGTVELEAVVNP